MYKILCVSDVKSGHGEVRRPIIGFGFAVSVLWVASNRLDVSWHKMETICTKIRLCRYVSHNKCWPDLTWPGLTWPPTVLRRNCDNRPNLMMSLWPDLTMYTCEILHIYALGINLKLYEISRRYRDAFQSYCRKTKGGQKMPPPPGRLSYVLLLHITTTVQ